MKRLTITRIIGLALVPLVVAGMFLWGLWDPVSRLNNVQAAVVNLDEPVEVDGQLTPLGRVLAAELVGGTSDENFTWVLTDEERASDGIQNGEFITVVTIPEEFSAAATSLSEGPSEARQATITIEHSERAKLLDQVLASVVTDTATRVLNDELGASFVGNIFVGMNELADGVGEIAAGADQLADGSTQLADGLGQFADGTSELVTGTNQLADGTGQFAAGVREAADGAHGFAAGAGEFAAGVGELGAGAWQVAGGSSELADGVAQYTGTINSVLEPLSGALKDQIPQLETLRDQILDGTIPIPEPTRQQLLEGIDALIGTPVMLDEAVAGGNALADGARQSAEGSAAIAHGIDELSAGAQGLAGGASELAQGISGLADGADGLASGASELASGVPTLAEGAEELASGARMSADGTAELAGGLDLIVSEIPRYSESEREAFADVAIAPVAQQPSSTELFSDSGAPLFSGIALWIGALASFLLITPLTARTVQAARSEAHLTLRSSLPSFGIGALQGMLIGTLIPIVMGLDVPVSLAFLGISVVAGIAFSLVNQGLVALTRGFGRFISFVVLAAAFAAGIISTSPGVMRTLGELSPIGSAVGGFQTLLTGESATTTFFVLLLWGALGFILIGAAVHRSRVRHVRSLG